MSGKNWFVGYVQPPGRAPLTSMKTLLRRLMSHCKELHEKDICWKLCSTLILSALAWNLYEHNWWVATLQHQPKSRTVAHLLNDANYSRLYFAIPTRNLGRGTWTWENAWIRRTRSNSSDRPRTHMLYKPPHHSIIWRIAGHRSSIDAFYSPRLQSCRQSEQAFRPYVITRVQKRFSRYAVKVITKFIKI